MLFSHQIWCNLYTKNCYFHTNGVEITPFDMEITPVKKKHALQLFHQ